MSFFDKDDTFSDFSAMAVKKVASASTPIHLGVLEQAIEDFAEQQLRAEAMGTALTFVEEGDFSSEALQGLLFGFVEDSDSEELTDEDAAHYESLAMSVVDAFKALGASEENAIAAIDGDEDAAESLGDFISSKLEDNPKSDEDIISRFAVENGMVLEAVKRVVRDGQVKMIRVPTRRKRLSAAQRAALRKARKKANTAAAKRARSKSMRKRASRGL